MNTYPITSPKINEFLNTIEDDKLKERYQVFCSSHETVFEKYKKNKDDAIPERRRAAEAFCKLLIYVYSDNAESMFNKNDMLTHTYTYDKIKKIYKREEKESQNIYINLIRAFLYILQEKDIASDELSQLENTLRFYPYNQESISGFHHAIPKDKQGNLSNASLTLSYLSCVRRMIDSCPDNRLKPLRDILPFDTDTISYNDVERNELEKRVQDDNELKLIIDDLLCHNNHEYGKKCVLVVSSNLDTELKKALTHIGWNMIIDFDPDTQKEDGLYSIFRKEWEGKREIVYTDVVSNGSKTTYWVEANGDGTYGKEPFEEKEENVANWKKKYLKSIVDKIKDLHKEDIQGEIILLDLYTKPTFPTPLYVRLLDLNPKIYRLYVSDSDKINDKQAELIDGLSEYKISQMQFARSVENLPSITTKSADLYKVSPAEIGKLEEMGIECVPTIPSNREKKDSGYEFYCGKKISWDELYDGVDVIRKGYENYFQKIESDIKRKTHFYDCILHDPCSGGTTSARRLAFDIMNKDSLSGLSFVMFISELKSSINVVCKRIKQFIEDQLPSETMPIFIIDRTISDENVEILNKKFVETTYRTSIIRVSYGDSKKNKKGYIISDSVLPEEKPNFDRLYRRHINYDFKDVTQIIEYPLLLQHYDNMSGLDGYVQEWLSKIEGSYKSVIETFSILASVASLYVNNRDRYFDPEFLWSIFDSSKFWQVYSSMSPKSKEAFLKLFEVEIDDDKQIRTGRLRTKFSIFGKSMIHNSNVGAYELAKKYLDCVFLWNNDSRMEYVYDVFTRTPDLEYDDDKTIEIKDKVSGFFKDFKCDSDTILAIYKLLIEKFPNDANCKLSYAQFLYNKAYYVDKDLYFEDKEYKDGDSFIEAENILIGLLDGNPSLSFTSLVYQSLGVLYFRKVGIIREEQNKQILRKAHKQLLEYCEICKDNCEKSLEQDATSAYALVTKAQILKTTINLTKRTFDYPDWTFCEKSPYLDLYLDYIEACSSIAKHCPDENKCTSSKGRELLKLYNRLDDYKRKLDGEGGKELFDKYCAKLETATDKKIQIMYGSRLYDVCISARRSQAREDISKLTDKQLSKIEQATRKNAQMGVSGSYEKLLFLYIFNNRTERTIDNAIELLKEWSNIAKTNEEKLWLNYYFMVFYAVKIIKEGRIKASSLSLFNEAKRSIDEYCKNSSMAEKDTIAFFYYQDANELQCITEDRDKATLVEGKISWLNDGNRRRGKVRLDCGLDDVSFSANDKKYKDADINVTRMKGAIGFRFSGLGLYGQDIIRNDQDKTETDLPEQFNDNGILEDDEKENAPLTDNNSRCKIKVVGKIQLPEAPVKKLNKSSDTSNYQDKNIQGEYKKIENKVVIQTSNKFHYEAAHFANKEISEEIYDGANVIFDIEPRPKPGYPNHKVAVNIRFDEKM